MQNESEILQQALETLKKGGVILYPTDTVWGIGCDAANAEAVAKIYALKQREENKAMICLVSDVRMLESCVEQIPDAAYDIIEYSDKPTTIIYDNPLRVAENLIGADNSLAIRVVKSGFAHRLVRSFRKPIVSTSANISGENTPKNFQEISSLILNGVDYVVNLQPENPQAKPSAIIRLKNNGEVQIIRK